MVERACCRCTLRRLALIRCIASGRSFVAQAHHAAEFADDEEEDESRQFAPMEAGAAVRCRLFLRMTFCLCALTRVSPVAPCTSAAEDEAPTKLPPGGESNEQLTAALKSMLGFGSSGSSSGAAAPGGVPAAAVAASAASPSASSVAASEQTAAEPATTSETVLPL